MARQIKKTLLSRCQKRGLTLSGHAILFGILPCPPKGQTLFMTEPSRGEGRSAFAGGSQKSNPTTDKRIPTLALLVGLQLERPVACSGQVHRLSSAYAQPDKPRDHYGWWRRKHGTPPNPVPCSETLQKTAHSRFRNTTRFWQKCQVAVG